MGLDGLHLDYLVPKYIVFFLKALRRADCCTSGQLLANARHRASKWLKMHQQHRIEIAKDVDMLSKTCGGTAGYEAYAVQLWGSSVWDSSARASVLERSAAQRAERLDGP